MPRSAYAKNGTWGAPWGLFWHPFATFFAPRSAIIVWCIPTRCRGEVIAVAEKPEKQPKPDKKKGKKDKKGKKGKKDK